MHDQHLAHLRVHQAERGLARLGRDGLVVPLAGGGVGAVGLELVEERGIDHRVSVEELGLDLVRLACGMVQRWRVVR